MRAGHSWGIFLLIQPIIGGVVILIGFFALLSPLIDYATSEFGVTNKRVIIKVGFLRRKTLELLLRHVEAISVDQSVMGRLLNYGSVTLTGTGGVREVFHNISKPLGVSPADPRGAVLRFYRQVESVGPIGAASIQVDISNRLCDGLFFGFLEQLLKFRF